MTKQTKRKGFTAIEMLVVIAIIAGLTAVVIPVVGNQTVKSKAAVNAANLRTIESAISMKMAEDPDSFEAYFQNGGGHKDISESILGKIYDSFFGEGEAGELADKYLLQYADTNTDGTTISINGTSPVVTIPGVALARVMEAPRRDGSTGLVINPGADEYMSVYISEEGVLAFYGNYTKEDFADVAQDGYYDGTVSAGSGGNSGGIQGWIETGVCKLQGKHAPGPGCKCLTCGEVAHLDADKGIMQNYNSSTTLHECRCGKVFISGHIYEGSNHACKYKKNYKEACPEVSPCEDTDPKSWRDEADHKCYLCNAHMPDECVGHDNSPANHYCDVCGEWVKGSVCGVDTDNNFSCDVCGKALEHECFDGTDNEHICDVPGCNKTVADAVHTRGGGGWFEQDKHHCSQCRAEIDKCKDDDTNHSCDICGKTLSDCKDNDNDGKCDTCGDPVGGGSCVTPDTLITLVDGSKKRVDQLDGSEELLVWNLETGAYDSAPIMFIDSEAECEAEVIYLHFSDGTLVKVITEHGFWDYTLNMYVYLDRGAEAYIGHTFFKQSENGGEKVELVDVEFKTEVTTAWSPVTVGHLCYFVNDMLSMPGGIRGLFNIFDVDPETMTYDYEAMARDIETYGLLSYEELSSVIAVPEDMFNAAGGAYLNIAMGKGQLTEGELFAMIQRYSVHFE